jgi:hypothetical protein
MKEATPQGVDRIRPDSRIDLPVPVFVNAGGHLVPEGQGIPGALIHRNFLFCLEPACGVAYTKSQRSERSKLATLGVDNRSTATTILAAGRLASGRTFQRFCPGCIAAIGTAQGNQGEGA